MEHLQHSMLYDFQTKLVHNCIHNSESLWKPAAHTLLSSQIIISVRIIYIHKHDWLTAMTGHVFCVMFCHFNYYTDCPEGGDD